MWIFDWKTTCFLAAAFCCGCKNEELAIEPIGDGIYVRYSYYDAGVEKPVCVDSFQYYTIANYKRISPDSLYKVLNKYIYSRYPYEKYIENLLRESHCNFYARFYEKSLFVNYGKHLFGATYYSEVGNIYEYNHKLVAMVYNYRWDSIIVFNTILYDTDKCSIFFPILEPILSFDNYIYQKCKYNIKWEKEDTIMIQPE